MHHKPLLRRLLIASLLPSGFAAMCRPYTALLSSEAVAISSTAGQSSPTEVASISENISTHSTRTDTPAGTTITEIISTSSHPNVGSTTSPTEITAATTGSSLSDGAFTVTTPTDIVSIDTSFTGDASTSTVPATTVEIVSPVSESTMTPIDTTEITLIGSPTSTSDVTPVDSPTYSLDITPTSTEISLDVTENTTEPTSLGLDTSTADITPTSTEISLDVTENTTEPTSLGLDTSTADITPTFTEISLDATENTTEPVPLSTDISTTAADAITSATDTSSTSVESTEATSPTTQPPNPTSALATQPTTTTADAVPSSGPPILQTFYLKGSGSTVAVAENNALLFQGPSARAILYIVAPTIIATFTTTQFYLEANTNRLMISGVYVVAAAPGWVLQSSPKELIPSTWYYLTCSPATILEGSPVQCTVEGTTRSQFKLRALSASGYGIMMEDPTAISTYSPIDLIATSFLSQTPAR